MGLKILLYVPNIIGYIRLILMVFSWLTYYSDPWMSCVLYSIQLSLDFVDGWSARKLNQMSAFGAWFDVLIDVLGRGMIWCRLYSFGYLVVCLEWLCFVCTHTLGSSWKTEFVQEPWFVKVVMANNFRSMAGLVAIGGLHVLPVWLYGHYHGLLTQMSMPVVIQYIGIGVLAAGRALCATVETWCIWSHIQYLISDEANKTYKGKPDMSSND